MEKLIELIFPKGDFSFSGLIFALIFAFIAIKAFYDSIKWIGLRFNDYHNIKKEEEKTEQRIKELEEQTQEQSEQLSKLNSDIKECINLLTNIQKNQTETTLETNRSVIFRIYHDALKQGSISQTELDRFINIVCKYEEAGGNGIVKDKIYPEILKMPINKEDKKWE